MKHFVLLVAFFVASICCAQQWNSEDEINSYYNNEISQIQAEITKYKQRRDYALGLPNEDQNGNPNKEKTDIMVEAGVMIAVLEQNISNLEEKRSKDLGDFRQRIAAQRMREEEQRKQQELVHQRQQQHNTSQKQKQQLEQERQRQDAIARKNAEEQERIREEQKRIREEQERIRREQERARKERLFNEGFARAMASSAGSTERKLHYLNQMDDNHSENKSRSALEATGMSGQSRSGFIPSSSSISGPKSSKSSIFKNVRKGKSEGDDRAMLLELKMLDKQIQELEQQLKQQNRQ